MRQVSRRHRFSSLELLALLALCLSATAGCQDSLGERFPVAQLEPAQFFFGRVVQGRTATRLVELRNIGGAPLVIERVALEVPPTGDTLALRWGEDAAALREGLVDGADAFPYPLRIEPGAALYFEAAWTPLGDAPEGPGRVVLDTNLPEPQLAIPLLLDEGSPQIALDRQSIDFGRVEGGQVALETLVVRNLGQQPLTLQAPRTDGSRDFRAVAPGFPHVIAPEGDLAFQVRYGPRQEGPDRGVLWLTSDDPNQPELGVPLVGNAGIPCLVASPAALEFRSSLVDRSDTRGLSLQSCGGQAVTVEDVRLEAGSDPAFELVPLDVPLMLPPADSVGPLPAHPVEVRFTPRAERLHRGAILVASDDPEKPLRRIPLLGRGAVNACPLARAAEANVVVAPGEAIVLDGSPSVDLDGPDNRPVEWRWSIIDGPAGSLALPFEQPFDPARPCDGGPADLAGTPTAFFCPEVPGLYRLRLEVTDTLGLTSAVCDADERVAVQAVPDEAVHVQLTWRAPGDPDPSDGAGPDADLHLLHPLGEWGGVPYDCHYANPVPDWGQLDNPADDPILDVDDIGGGGPENVRLAVPEPTGPLGAPYAVGVEYYRSDDRVDPIDYGPIFVTVRAYVRGELAWTYDGPAADGARPGEIRLEREGDRRLMFELHWPSGDVITLDRAP